MIERVFRRVSMIQMVTLLMAVIGMLIDSIIIGQYLGVTCMAAYGLAAPILTLFSAVGGTIATGAQTACSKALGLGDAGDANRKLSVSMFLGLVISVAGTAAVFAAAHPIAIAFGAGESAELTTATVAYLRGYILGAPGLILVLIGLPFMQLDSDRNRAIVGAVLMTIADIVLDLLNVLVFDGGMFGMGLASAISVYCALVVLLLHFVHKKFIFHLSFRKLDFVSLGDIVKTGLPYAVGQVCRTILVITLNRLFLHIGGSDAVAAYAVANTLWSVICIPGSAVGTSSVILSSVMNAEKNVSALRDIVKSYIKYAVLYNIIVAVVVLIFAPAVVGIFLHGNAETAAIACAGARFMGISMIVAGISCGCRNYFQGIDRLKVTQIMCVGSTYVCIVVPALILSPFMGTNGVWLAFILADILVMLGVVILAARERGHFPHSLDDFLFLAKDFGIPEEDLLEYDIHTTEDVIRASMEVGAFCKAHGADLKTRMNVALAIEEMGTNVVDFALQDKPNGLCHLRIFCQGNETKTWTVSFKDDCAAFNPPEYLELCNDEDKTKNIGLRMITGMAKDIRYMHTLDLNNLVIELR